MVMSEEQPAGQPPVNKKKDIAPAGVQASALGALPSPEPSPTPTPAPAPTPHPGQDFLNKLEGKGLYDSKTKRFKPGLNTAAHLNAELNRQGGRATAAPWVIDFLHAAQSDTELSTMEHSSVVERDAQGKHYVRPILKKK